MRDLRPAKRTCPDPEGGWRGADLSPDELVDDQFIEADPDSKLIPAEPPRGT